MIDLYLRTNNEAEMLDAFRNVGLLRTIDDQEIIAPPPHTSVDVIGTIYERTGTRVDDEGVEVPVFTTVSGWHANVRTRDKGVVRALSDVSVDPKPNTPYRVWV